MLRVITGDAAEQLCLLPADSVHCVVTSPPYYGLRDYGVPGQLGLEASPAEYVEALVGVFREVRRVLRPDGTLWLNLGDSYNSSAQFNNGSSGGVSGSYHEGDRKTWPGHRKMLPGYKPKDLLGIPWMVAFALRADGWWLRQDIIWAKPNPMPESVTDRCTKAHEYLFLMSKSARYWFDAEAIAEQASENTHARGNGQGREGSDPRFVRSHAASYSETVGRGAVLEARNKRSVWTVASEPFPEAHFATYPPALIEPCILAGCPKGGTVLDPFGGAGTTGLVADRLGRNAILIELNPGYAEMAKRRLYDDCPLFCEVA